MKSIAHKSGSTTKLSQQPQKLTQLSSQKLTQPRSGVSVLALTPDEILDEDANISELDDPRGDTVVPLEAVLNVVKGDESDEHVSCEKGVWYRLQRQRGLWLSCGEREY